MKAVFLDRDGVLNVDHGYIHKIEDLEWIEEAREAIAYLNAQGYKVFVVTNQSGVARGYYKIGDVQNLHAYMQKELKQKGGLIERFYICPHHPEGKVPKYTKICDCRKPKPGMLLQAMKDYSLNREDCFLIGDKDSDIAAANKAGIKGHLFLGGSLLQFVKQFA